MLAGHGDAGTLSWRAIRNIEKDANVLSGFLADVGRSGKERVEHVDSEVLHASNGSEGEESLR